MIIGHSGRYRTMYGHAESALFKFLWGDRGRAGEET